MPTPVVNMLQNRLKNNPAYQQAMGPQIQQPGYASPRTGTPVNTGGQTPPAQPGLPQGKYPAIQNAQLFNQWLPGGAAQQALRQQYGKESYDQNRFGLQTRHADAIAGNAPSPLGRPAGFGAAQEGMSRGAPQMNMPGRMGPGFRQRGF